MDAKTENMSFALSLTYLLLIIFLIGSLWNLYYALVFDWNTLPFSVQMQFILTILLAVTMLVFVYAVIQSDKKMRTQKSSVTTRA